MLSHDKATSNMEKKTKPSVFTQRLNFSNHLSSNTALWLLDLDVNWGPWRGESRPLKTNATWGCLAYHTEMIKRTILYGNRSTSSPGVGSFFSINRQVSQVIMVRPRLPSWYAAENRTARNNGWYRHTRRPRKSRKDNINKWTGQAMPSLLRIADDRIR